MSTTPPEPDPNDPVDPDLEPDPKDPDDNPDQSRPYEEGH